MRLFGLEIARARRPQTQFLGDVAKVALSPGDVCVLMSRDPLTADNAARISQAWRAAVGEEVTLIVLDSGMKLGVLSPPQAAEVHEKLTDQATVAAVVAA